MPAGAPPGEAKARSTRVEGSEANRNARGFSRRILLGRAGQGAFRPAATEPGATARPDLDPVRHEVVLPRRRINHP